MSLELNKIAASVLTAGVVAMGSGFVANLLIHPDVPDEPAYKVATQESTGGTQEAAKPKGPEPIAPLLASADPAAGEQASRVCSACHSFDKGGPNKVGPNLWNIVNAPIAGHEDFNYSSALSDKEGEWTYANLNQFLYNPSDWAPGTIMSYNGVKDVEKRANIVAYLRSLADDPAPLPEGEDVAQAQEAAATTDGGESANGAADGEMAAGDSAQADSAQSDSAQADTAQAETGGQEDTTQETADAGAADGEAEQGESTGGEATQTQTADASGGNGGGGSGIVAQVAAADPSTGQSASQVCAACHSFNKGGPHKVGPNLWGVMNRDIAAAEGYSYSNALKGKEGEWTYERMWAYLENPQGWAPGTRMSYPGVKDEADRAAIIAYMREQADNPPPLKE